MPESLRDRLFFASALAPYLWLVERFNFVTDDAFISFRYSRNLAEGLGFRYNMGVEPPVEGFSNLGWVLWIAPFEALAVDPGIASRLTSVACGLLLVWRLSERLRAQLGATGLPWLAGLLFFTTLPAAAVWTTSGLATLPFALLIFLAYEALLAETGPRTTHAALLLVLLVLLRADGLFFAAVLVGTAGVAWCRTRSDPLLRAAALCGGVAILTFAALTAWRYVTFGDFVPNTARAKVVLSADTLLRGLNYDLRFVTTFVSVPLVAVLATVLLRAPRRLRDLQNALLAAAPFGYAILVGGDFMCMGRFLVPALPFHALLLGASVARLGELGVGSRTLAAGVAALTLLSILPGHNVRVVPESLRSALKLRRATQYVRWQKQAENARRWTELGQALAWYANPGDSLTIGHIGAVGYHSRLVIHDRRGLVDREVARLEFAVPLAAAGHDKLVSPTYFLDREPTFLEARLISAAPGGVQTAFAELRREGSDPMLRHYRGRAIPLPPDLGITPGRVLWVVERQNSDSTGQ